MYARVYGTVCDLQLYNKNDYEQYVECAGTNKDDPHKTESRWTKKEIPPEVRSARRQRSESPPWRCCCSPTEACLPRSPEAATSEERPSSDPWRSFPKMQRCMLCVTTTHLPYSTVQSALCTQTYSSSRVSRVGAWMFSVTLGLDLRWTLPALAALKRRNNFLVLFGGRGVPHVSIQSAWAITFTRDRTNISWYKK